jgi:hypothetical protein
MHGGEAPGGPQHPDELELSEADRFLETCVQNAPGIGKHACRNAIQHLQRAWRIREIDPEMALFRAITAEEEAAKAIFYALNRHGYAGADLLKDNHRHKAAVIPFCAAVGEAISAARQLRMALIPHAASDPPQIRLRVAWTIPDGREVSMVVFPPLSGRVLVDGEAVQFSFMAELDAIAGGKGVDGITAYVSRQANARNAMLYASDRGIPRIKGSIASDLLRKKQNVFSLVVFFLLIDQYRGVQPFAQNCLRAFIDVLRLVDEGLDRRLRRSEHGDRDPGKGDASQAEGVE